MVAVTAFAVDKLTDCNIVQFLPSNRHDPKARPGKRAMQTDLQQFDPW